jgi:glyoxylase-like metal-dependent hydrolase (beta-lactamase superfamily II)
MNRVVWAVGLGLLTSACIGGRSRPAGDALDPVERALAAEGGAEKVAAVETLTVKGSAKQWEPEQSVKPGGEPRFANDATFVTSRSLTSGAARIEWVKNFVYPSPREYRYTEIVTPGAGCVLGVDSTARTKQSLESNPPRHAMSGVRLAATQRELARTSPRLLLDMRSHPGQLTRLPDVAVAGKSLQAVKYQAGDVDFIVLFDAQTGLPARVRTLDADNIRGDSTYDLVLEDWRDVGGVKIPHQQRYELAGTEVMRITYEDVRPNPAIAGEVLEVPADLLASAPKPATRNVPYQWALRRQHIGTYLDSDAVSFDTASSGLRLADVAPGVAQVVGGSHNSLIVEMSDHLIVFDAPVGEWQSRWTLDAARAKYPGKPVKYLVLSHHHMDHAGGARTYVAEGATVLVGAGNGPHFTKVFSAAHRIDDDALQKSPRRAEVVEVDDKKILSDGKRAVEIYRIENPHADGMLIGYVPDAKLGFVVDLWSPGRDKLGDKPTPGQAALVAAVRKRGLALERFAGGHGTVADYAPLEALASAER